MGRLFVFMGKSASGKDAIFRYLRDNKELGLKEIVPYTTRPMRKGEENGVGYYFVDQAAYEKMCQNGKVIESRTYETINGPWHYFTVDDGQIRLDRDNAILIGTLEVYNQMKRYFGEEQVVPLYIEVEDGTRLIRAVEREQTQEHPGYEELCRRFLADAKDFSEENLKNAGITRRFENKDMNACLEEIKLFIQKAILI